jgi:hypothetical protein
MLSRSPDSETIEAEIDRVRLLGLDELRTLWRTTLRSPPPRALTRDLLARFLCWHIQEQALGGLDRETANLLDRFARAGKPGAGRPRRLRPGTVLVREYQGERYTVTVVADGFVWREATYASLSTIARAITGTAWSGPRFFGLRAGANRREDTTRRRYCARDSPPRSWRSASPRRTPSSWSPSRASSSSKGGAPSEPPLTRAIPGSGRC